MAKFISEIRKHMKFSPEKAIFLFVDNVIPPTGLKYVKLPVAALMSQINEKHKDHEDFL